MENSVDVFIAIHDQTLVEGLESSGVFAPLGSYKYLFLGSRSVDRIRNFKNVIVVRDLPKNIEEMNYLVDFTGWFAITKNALGKASDVILLQYDIIPNNSFFADYNNVRLHDPNSLVGFIPWEMKDENFLRNNMGAKPLIDAVRDVYGLSVEELVSDALKAGDSLWPSANCVAMKREYLNCFVEWFMPIARQIGNTPQAGHSFERAIKIYGLLSGIKMVYLPGLLKHIQNNSHGTQLYTVAEIKKRKKIMSDMLGGGTLLKKIYNCIITRIAK